MIRAITKAKRMDFVSLQHHNVMGLRCMFSLQLQLKRNDKLVDTFMNSDLKKKNIYLFSNDFWL